MTEAVTTGSGFTVTLTTAWLVLVQPAELVPTTAYVDVVTGANVTPFVIPPVHVYVEAPCPLAVVVSPKQITGLVRTPVTTGNGFTVTVVLAVLIQPLTSVPVTV